MASKKRKKLAPLVPRSTYNRDVDDLHRDLESRNKYTEQLVAELREEKRALASLRAKHNDQFVQTTKLQHDLQQALSAIDTFKGLLHQSERELAHLQSVIAERDELLKKSNKVIIGLIDVTNDALVYFTACDQSSSGKNR